MLRPPLESGQYTSLALTEALTEAGVAGSIGSVGDALDNALMESTIGLFKIELIDRQRSWSGWAEVKRETAAWIHWVQHQSAALLDRLPAAGRVRTATP